MASKIGKGVLIFATLVIYIIHLVINSFAGKGGNSLFPRSVGNVSRVYHLEMTPTGATFSIWGIIFTYQFIWLLYAVSTVFRNGDKTNILSNKFYLSFIANILFVTAWLFVWSRLEAVWSFVVISTAQIFIDITIGLACSDLASFDSTHPVSDANKFDVWCQRVLVQNGLLFYGTWTTIATLINTAVVLAYEIGLSTETASLICLSILGVLVIVWFALESFVLEKYTEYTISAYITLIYGVSGIVANIWGKNKAVAGLSLGLLILSIIFFIARLVIIIVRSKKRSSEHMKLTERPLK